MAERAREETKDIPSRTRESDEKTGPSRDHAPPSPEQVDGMIAGPLDGKRERRRTAPPPPADPTHDEKNEANAIVASLRAAQHELDAKISSPDPTPSAKNALKHLMHGVDCAELYGATVGHRAVTHACDAFGVSLADFLVFTTVEDAVETDLTEYNHVLRARLGLPEHASKPKDFRKELRADASYMREAIPPAFDMIATRTSGLLQALEQSTPTDDRDAIASDGAGRIVNHVNYVVWLLESLDTPELRHPYKAHAKQAANQILRVRKWVRERTANARLNASLSSFTTVFDIALGLVGGAPLVMNDTAPLRDGEDDEVKHEKIAFDDAKTNFYGALDDLEDYKIAGGNLASKLIEEDVSPSPSFLEDLFSAVLVATIGQIGGRIAGILLGKQRRAPARPTDDERRRESLVGLLADVTTDSIQGVAASSVAKSKGVGLKTTSAFFFHGLTLEASNFTTTYRERIRERIKFNDISANEIEQETAHLRSLIRADEVTNMYCAEAARGWASYVAQSQLGLNVGASFAGKRVTNLDGFFDDRRPSIVGMKVQERRIVTDHSGVLDVRLDLGTSWSISGPIEMENVRLRSIRVVGFGEAFTAMVLGERPSLDRVPLPKRILVRFGHGVPDLEAGLAVDEDGIVRDAWNWGAVDPHAFWAVIRSMKAAP